MAEQDIPFSVCMISSRTKISKEHIVGTFEGTLKMYFSRKLCLSMCRVSWHVPFRLSLLPKVAEPKKSLFKQSYQICQQWREIQIALLAVYEANYGQFKLTLWTQKYTAHPLASACLLVCIRAFQRGAICLCMSKGCKTEDNKSFQSYMFCYLI